MCVCVNAFFSNGEISKVENDGSFIVQWRARTRPSFAGQLLCALCSNTINISGSISASPLEKHKNVLMTMCSGKPFAVLLVLKAWSLSVQRTDSPDDL